MSLLKQIFTWWNGQTIGTRFHTWRFGTKVGQDRAELIIEIMGHQGLGWEGEGFSAEELSFVRGWLGGKATTIFGGSQEIQSNIISKRILGLPDPLNQSN